MRLYDSGAHRRATHSTHGGLWRLILGGVSECFGINAVCACVCHAGRVIVIMCIIVRPASLITPLAPTPPSKGGWRCLLRELDGALEWDRINPSRPGYAPPNERQGLR